MSGEGGGDSEGERRPLLGQASGSRDTFGRNQTVGHRQTQDSARSGRLEGGGDLEEAVEDEGGQEDEKGRMSWREWMGERLESPRTHKIVLTLIAIDACCVLADLAYEFLSPDKGCQCGDTSSNLLLSNSLNNSLTPVSTSSESLAPDSLVPSLSLSLLCRLTLTTRTLEGEDDPTWLTILSHLSLVINALFVLEIPLAIWCFGLQYYMPFRLSSFSASTSETQEQGRERERDVERGASDVSKANIKTNTKAKAKAGVGSGALNLKPSEKEWGEVHPYAALHLFDALVVLATFVLEVVLRGRERELAGLLVLLRLWRLVKLVGGIAVGAGEIQEELSEEIARKEELLQNAQARIAELEAENARLKSQTQILNTGEEEEGKSVRNDANGQIGG